MFVEGNRGECRALGLDMVAISPQYCRKTWIVWEAEKVAAGPTCGCRDG
jgi:hypothetical protein